MSRTYSLFSTMMAMFRRPRLARYYASRARSIAESIGDRHAMFRAMTMGQLPAFIRGEWRECESALDEGLALGAELRNVHECLLYGCSRAYVSFHQGRLDDALVRFRDILSRAKKIDDPVPQLWAGAGAAEVLFRRGRFDEAIGYAEECLATAERTSTVDQNSRFQVHGLLAAARLRQEGIDRALPDMEQAIAAAAAGARLSYTPQSGFAGVADVLFAVWNRGGPDADEARARLRRWLRGLRLTAFCRPMLDPWDLVFRASWHERQGHRLLATRELGRAIRRADEMGLVYESGWTRAQLGCLLRSGDPRRATLIEDACAMFDRLGSAHLSEETRRRATR
jgi:ATP/maltotriose-dependent transcriptional regulator MalT